MQSLDLLDLRILHGAPYNGHRLKIQKLSVAENVTIDGIEDMTAWKIVPRTGVLDANIAYPFELGSCSLTNAVMLGNGNVTLVCFAMAILITRSSK